MVDKIRENVEKKGMKLKGKQKNPTWKIWIEKCKSPAIE